MKFKWIGLLIAVVAVILVLVFLCFGRKQDKNAYGATVAALGDEDLFALVEVGDLGQILLVTDKVFDVGTESQASISCEVYYNFHGEVKNLGAIESSGTAYPIAYDETGLYVAGGHFIGRYEINKDSQTLEIVESYNEIFDEDGNATYRCEKNGEENAVEEEDFLNAFDGYGKATIVHFGYGATGDPN